MSIVSLSFCQLSIVKFPVSSSEKISANVNVRVSRVFAFKGELRGCLNVFTVPFFP